MAERSVSALSCALETGRGGAGCPLCVHPGFAQPPGSQTLRGGWAEPLRAEGLAAACGSDSPRGLSPSLPAGAPAPPQAILGVLLCCSPEPRGCPAVPLDTPVQRCRALSPGFWPSSEGPGVVRLRLGNSRPLRQECGIPLLSCPSPSHRASLKSVGDQPRWDTCHGAA